MAREAREIDRERGRRKFEHPDWTAKAERRASVPFERLDTLWINTGTLCNITCRNCYIELSPTNDRLDYITADEAARFLDEAAGASARARSASPAASRFSIPISSPWWRTRSGAVSRSSILTNAMLPMQRPAHRRRSSYELKDALRRQAHAARQPRPLHEGAPRRRARRRHLGADDRRARLARGERLCDRNRRAHLLGRERGGGSRWLRSAFSRARAGRSTPATSAQLVLFPEMDGGGRRARDHDRMLGHPEEAPEPDDVRHLAHGREAQGRGCPRRAAVHAAPLRARLRDGRHARRGAERRRRHVRCTAPSSSVTRTAPSSASWAAAAAPDDAVAYFFTSASRISLR